MCLAVSPQFPQFNLTKEDLDSFYGPEMGGRRPAPPEQTLFMAERNAWREVHELMHSGMFLKEALEKMKNNSLFWMREVYETVITQQGEGKGKKGKDKKGQWGAPIRQTEWDEKGKGHGDKGGKGKGKTKNKPSDWPSNWAFKNPKGVPFCRTISSRNSVRASVAGLTIAQSRNQGQGSEGHLSGFSPNSCLWCCDAKRCNPAVSPSGKPAVGRRSPTKPNLNYQGTCLTFWDSVKPILG